jgi:hypothetical protein
LLTTRPHSWPPPNISRCVPEIGLPRRPPSAAPIDEKSGDTSSFVLNNAGEHHYRLLYSPSKAVRKSVGASTGPESDIGLVHIWPSEEKEES